MVQTQINESRTSIQRKHLTVVKELEERHRRSVIAVREAERENAVRAMKKIIQHYERSMEAFELVVQVRVKAVKTKEKENWSSVELKEYETELKEDIPFKFKPDIAY